MLCELSDGIQSTPQALSLQVAAAVCLSAAPTWQCLACQSGLQPACQTRRAESVHTTQALAHTMPLTCCQQAAGVCERSGLYAAQRTSQELAKSKPQPAIVSSMAHRPRKVAVTEAQWSLKYPVKQLCCSLYRLLCLGGLLWVSQCGSSRFPWSVPALARTSDSVELAVRGSTAATRCRNAAGDLS